jgi:hypothetical protein
MFIETRTGNINTAFIKRIVERTSTDRNGTWSETVGSDADGHEYVLDNQEDMIKRLNTPITIVPATTPMTLIAIGVGSGDEEPLIERFPIIAWRVTPDGYPDPVAVGCDVYFFGTDESPYFIELPSGKFQHVEYMGRLFESLDACRDARNDDTPHAQPIAEREISR